MKIALVGPSYTERSLPFDAQRTINLYPVLDESQMGKEVSALFGTPGLLLFATCGTGPIRGSFASANGRAFVISGMTLYEVFSDGTKSSLGTVDTVSFTCSFAENTSQLAVCDSISVYILDYATNVFTKIVTPNLPGAGTVTFQDGYFIVNNPDTGQFYLCALNDGLLWAALDFATAESSPDSLARVFSAFGNLWLFGDQTTEVWYDSGNVDFPFTRIEGAKMQTGCVAPHSVQEMDNSLFWLGKDRYGQGIVYRAQGYSPVRVSTHAIEYAISQATDLSLIVAYTYQDGGHLFYVLTGGGLPTTLVYDAATKMWHERAKLEDNGSFSSHMGATHMFAFGKHLVGDKDTGAIYEMSQAYFDDNGRAIKRQRVFTHIHEEAQRLRVKELQVDFEYGVGTSGQGLNPTAVLEVSTNGAKTWSPEYPAPIGAMGKYKTRAVWRRLGMSDIFTFRLSVTDPVKIAICGAYMK